MCPYLSSPLPLSGIKTTPNNYVFIWCIVWKKWDNVCHMGCLQRKIERRAGYQHRYKQASVPNLIQNCDKLNVSFNLLMFVFFSYDGRENHLSDWNDCFSPLTGFSTSVLPWPNDITTLFSISALCHLLGPNGFLKVRTFLQLIKCYLLYVAIKNINSKTQFLFPFPTDAAVSKETIEFIHSFINSSTSFSSPEASFCHMKAGRG